MIGTTSRAVAAGMMTFVCAGALATAQGRGVEPAPSTIAYDPALYQALRYRELGPFRGGRSTAVSGVAGEPLTFYMGNAGGLWKTRNAGQTWIGVSVSAANSNRVWALVEAEQGGLFRSNDGGDTWQPLKTNRRRRLFQRSWYFMHVEA